MFDRRLLACFDWGLLLIVVLISAMGMVILYSAVIAGSSVPQYTFCLKQMVWLFSGLCMIILFCIINYKSLDRWSIWIYIGCISLLVCVLFFGKMGGGSRRWIALGPFTVQPSELVKIGVIIILARYYSRCISKKGLTFFELFKPMLLVLIPVLLIVGQPDLGTGLLIIIIAGSITLFVKIERRTFFVLTGIGMVVVPMIWFFLKDYQKQRILTFLNPELDPLGAGYHIIQSKIAIGSGMIYGKDFLKGTQNALSFLPEQHTDFIFSVLAEEWGFVGSCFVLFVYLILIMRGLHIAYNCRSSFGTILAAGIVIMIVWQVFINVGMIMGLFPVVGVPLPLISYGGSSVLTTMSGIGILMGISMRKFVTE